MATALMKEEYPSYPPFISCTLMYWLILFDEDSFVEAMGGMVSQYGYADSTGLTLFGGVGECVHSDGSVIDVVCKVIAQRVT